MPTNQEELASLQHTHAWRFAGLVQSRLMRPVGEKVIVVPAKPEEVSTFWESGVFTFTARNGIQIRLLNGVERAGETWVESSQDGGKTWTRAAVITKEDEMVDMRRLDVVLRPYMYGKIVNGEPWVVLGTSAAEHGTKCWDIREREAPLAHLEQLKTAPARVVFPANAEYAYKDGMPIQGPDGASNYLTVTRHHTAGTREAAVNADTILCKRDEKSGCYDIVGLLLPRAARGVIDNTCNRLTCELVFPDGTRFWGCDIRNVEWPNAASKNPLVPGDLDGWTLGDFDEISSFAIGRWPADLKFPTARSVDAILGRSPYPAYPALRWLGVTLLIPAAELAVLARGTLSAAQENEAAISLTYERSVEAGSKNTYQQIISRKELAAVLTGMGPALIVGQDPAAVEDEEQQYRR